jgi:PII-like signaling protein/DNA-binding XRE family transcriptional regulator
MPVLANRPVGALLRMWRQRRGRSQLQLALHADVSSRHLSFVETGRSLPSRPMLARLAEQLEVPLRDRNVLMLAAGYAGATVFRAIMGFGPTARLHTDKVLRLSLDLPLVVECVDTEEKINAILPELDQMLDGGLITLEKAKVIIYRAHNAAG